MESFSALRYQINTPIVSGTKAAYADDGVVVHAKPPRIDLRRLAAGLAQEHYALERHQDIEGLVGDIAARGLHNEIHTLAVSHFLHLLHPFRLGTPSFSAIARLPRADGRDDLADTIELGQLDEEGSEAAGRAFDQDGLAFEAARIAQREGSCCAMGQEGCGVHSIETFGERDDGCDRNGDVLCISAGTKHNQNRSADGGRLDAIA